jgi:hypothetical protein
LMPSFGYGVIGSVPNSRWVFVSFSQNRTSGAAQRPGQLKWAQARAAHAAGSSAWQNGSRASVDSAA